jgi:hypothetical protein
MRRRTAKLTAASVVGLIPVSAILMAAGWFFTAMFVANVGERLYGDRLIYLYGSERKGVLPIVLTWLPLAAAILAASIPWIVFDLVGCLRSRRIEKSISRSN